MRKRFLSIFLLPFLLVGCKSEEHFDSKPIVVERSIGEIGSFDLISPDNTFDTDHGFTFTWEAASNADYYQLEISTLEDFSIDPEEVYVKENNLSLNKFDLTYSLPKKDKTYYWRVTAFNKDHTKVSNTHRHFVYRHVDVSEIPIEIEEAGDWELHKEGSYADISVDRNDFFQNGGKNSLVIKFDKEHTLQGITSSDGWIVVTKSEDRELNGLDAFYFNFFYSGQDSTILVRVLDEDGEYWHNRIQVANNSKQTVIMKFEDFELRTAGTNINNRTFDYNHIHYFEIVFEKTFGDGVAVFSDIKAVKFENYKHLFMDKMNFKRDDIDEWKQEYMTFNKDVSEDGSELTLSFTIPEGFKGWAVQYVNLFKFLEAGDAIRMKFKYTGVAKGATLYFRIYEEDGDTWQYKCAFGELSNADYEEILIPLKALQRLNGGMNGDGAKQLSYVKKFAFCINANYSAGSISVKDLEMVSLDNVIGKNRKIIVGSDGCIENFNSYTKYTEMYYLWDQSVVNKDESMKLDSVHKLGGTTNPYCGEFDYKADLEMASYNVFLDTTGVSGKNGISFWAKDMSPKQSEDKFPSLSYLTYEDIAAEMTIQLSLATGEQYRYTISKLDKEWTKYSVSFNDFKLFKRGSGAIRQITCDTIINFAFGLQYFFYKKGSDGKPDTKQPYPTYAIANPVYFDEIYLDEVAETTTETLPGTLRPDAGDPNYVTIDTIEEYVENEDILGYWKCANLLEYEKLTLANDVSSEGGSKSLKMKYRGQNSVSYMRSTQFDHHVSDDGVLYKGVTLDIKGDGKATVYVNLNVRNPADGSVYKLRHAIVGVAAVWKRYVIGYHKFTGIDSSTSSKKIYANQTMDIESISFGIVNDDAPTPEQPIPPDCYIYMDNIRMTKLVNYDEAKTPQILPTA